MPESTNDETPGFREVLKDGEQRDRAFAMMNPEGLEKASDEELAAIVRGYVNSQHQSQDYWKLVAVLKTERARLTPLLLKATLESGSEGRPPDKAKDILHETPLHRALQRLEPGEHPELRARLLALSTSSAPFVRRDIATHLAAFGSDDVISAVSSFLAQPEAPEAWAAMVGIKIALEKGRATPAYRLALFEPVAELNRRGMRNGDTHGDLLLALDAERGRAVLIELLGPNDLRTHHALNALGRAKVRVDAEILLGLLERNREPSPRERWRTGLYGSALRALARQKHPTAKAEIDRVLAEKIDPGQPRVRQFDNLPLQKQEEASNALLVWEDFAMPSLWDRYEKLGRAGVTEVERDLLSMADGQIGNGGFSQYFFNIDYDPRDDVAAMKRMGATEHAAILEKSFTAFKTFGLGGPHADQEKRMEQLEKMSEAKAAILGECDEAWFSSPESLTVLTNFYMLRHREKLQSAVGPAAAK